MARIVQAANFVSPRSGGIRTTLVALGRGYAAAGHEQVLIVPGEHDDLTRTPEGLRLTVRAPLVPGSGGYRVITDVDRMIELMERLRPDRLEVSDKLTLRQLGDWSRAHGVPAMAISHERVDALLKTWLGRAMPDRTAIRVADQLNQQLVDRFDQIVCTTAWAAAEFRRIHAPNVTRVALGVDLETFRPELRDEGLRRRLAPRGVLLVHASRLSGEKRPELAVDTLAELVDRGVEATLVVAGDGPRRRFLERRARGLPVHFLGFVRGRDQLARVLATADAAIAPGPVETFGLAALEALASGTPLVATNSGALRELLEPGTGLAVPGTPHDLADAVETVLDWDPEGRRAAARARAETFPWQATISGMLAAHQLTPERRRRIQSGPTARPPAGNVDGEAAG